MIRVFWVLGLLGLLGRHGLVLGDLGGVIILGILDGFGGVIVILGGLDIWRSDSGGGDINMTLCLLISTYGLGSIPQQLFMEVRLQMLRSIIGISGFW